MTQVLVTLLVACIPGSLALAGTIYVNYRTLKATRGKTDAEAIDIGIGAQNEVMKNLREELDRARTRLADAEKRADQLDRKLGKAERDYRILRHHFYLLSEWSRRYWNAGHPFGVEAPPEGPVFDDE